MKCNKCGCDNDHSNVFCCKCGEKFEPIAVKEENNSNKEKTNISAEKKKSSRLRKTILFGGAIISLLAILVVIMFLRQDYATQVMNYIDKGENVKALDIYNEKIINDVENVQLLKDLLIRRSEEIKEEYINEHVSYEVAIEELDRIFIFGIVGDAEKQENYTYIEDLKYSRDQFNEGNELIKTNPYSSIACFKMVIEEDSNYEEAQTLLNQAKDNYKEESINEAKKLGDGKKYKEAIAAIEKCQMLLKEDIELEEIKNEYVVQVNAQVLEQAEELIQDEKYEEARELLTGNKEYNLDNTISNKLDDISKLKKEAAKLKLNEIKPRLNVVYDEVDGNITIVPSGYSTRYHNLSRYLNIELRIIVNASVPTLAMVTGFVNDDWLFFEKVIFACDNDRESVKVGYFDKETKILGGGDIAEWYIMIHSESGIESGQLKDLEPLINNIINSEKSTIRFAGDGFIDHTITSNEKQAIKDMWEAYVILNEYPQMIDLIK